MTVLELPPRVAAPADAVAELHGVLDRIDVSGVRRDELASVVGEVERALSRLEAVKLRLLAQAERCRVSDGSGLTGTAAWLARQTRSGAETASRSVRLATALDADHDPTARALDAGELSPDHAAVIVAATDRLPAGLTAPERTRVEESLVDQARRLDPVRLRRVARRALAVIEADPALVDAHEGAVLRDEEEAARARCRLTLHDNGDGTTSGHFTVPTFAASVLQRVIHSMTAPRRARLGATSAQAGDSRWRDDWSHRAGVAFVELLEHLPTDHLHAKVAATVVVTLDLGRLRAALGAADVDTGDRLSAGEIRRLACAAGILPAVLSGPSLPLDLGRSSRLFSDTQRTALGVRHPSCAADGCDRPYSWCELHHNDPWSGGGPTDLVNAVPLCAFHHRRVHDLAYHHRAGPHGITFHRRT